MLLLLSPAKNMDFSVGPKNHNHNHNEPMFLQESNYLADKMKKLSSRQMSKLMSLNPELSDLNVTRYENWNTDGNDRREAILAFNGEVYRGLNAHDFSENEMEFAQEHLLVLSGLYGLLRPLDVIQPYRLEMGCKLKVTSAKTNLYKYWDDKLTNKLKSILEEHKSKFILNLASSEYSKAIDKKSFDSQFIDCHFLDWKGGEFKAVMTWAKNARGSMANYVVKHEIDDLKTLESVAFNGYQYNPSLSDEKNLVYTRK